jgi:hypothetical protein
VWITVVLGGVLTMVFMDWIMFNNLPTISPRPRYQSKGGAVVPFDMTGANAVHAVDGAQEPWFKFCNGVARVQETHTIPRFT